jgi:DNA ligase-1
MDYFNLFRAEQYEGAMLRNKDSKYVNKRSYDLLKLKEFDDDEFEIIGIEEGRGKLAGHVGAFVCKTSDGKTFLAKMSGDTEKLADYFKDHSLWSGKRLTVQYQGLTGKERVPRFPVGKSIRDYE